MAVCLRLVLKCMACAAATAHLQAEEIASEVAAAYASLEVPPELLQQQAAEQQAAADAAAAEQQSAAEQAAAAGEQGITLTPSVMLWLRG